MVFLFGFREVLFDVLKPVFSFRPIVEVRKPVLVAQPCVEARRTAHKTEHGNEKKRQLGNHR